MECNKLRGELLVADKVTFDKEKKCFTAHHILNVVTVPLFPSAIITNLLVKLYVPSADSVHELDIEVKDGADELVFYESVGEVKNVRTNLQYGMLPGIDTSVICRFPVTSQGTYTFKLYVDKQLLSTYPLYIQAIV
ncbi:MAG: hypothetical protein K0Q73_8443 [Paenibacillus sp.]|nr:hypothetical protein [Paenibacillus sp.]